MTIQQRDPALFLTQAENLARSHRGEILEQIDFTPAAIRADLREQRLAPRYLYSAAELVDRAADLLAEGAVLVHDSERRWRIFWGRLQALTGPVSKSL